MNTYTFDCCFDADGRNRMPISDGITIAMVEQWQKDEDEQNKQPQTIEDALRKTNIKF